MIGYRGAEVDVREDRRGARGALRAAGERPQGRAAHPRQRAALRRRDGRSVWGNTYERDLTARDLFELQDELTQQVVNAIAGSYGALTRAELPAARRKAPDEPGQLRLRPARLRVPARPHRREPPRGPRVPGKRGRDASPTTSRVGPGWPTSTPSSTTTAGTSDPASTTSSTVRWRWPRRPCGSTPRIRWPTGRWRWCSSSAASTTEPTSRLTGRSSSTRTTSSGWR